MHTKSMNVKRARFECLAFKRTIGVYDEYDEIKETIVIAPKRAAASKRNFVYDVHESVVSIIQCHLEFDDLVNLKTSCVRGNALVSDEDVVDRMVEEMQGASYALCACVYNRKEKHVHILLSKYGDTIDIVHIMKLIVYLIFAKLHEMCHMLMRYVDFPIQPAVDHDYDDMVHYVFTHCYCGQSLSCMTCYVVSCECGSAHTSEFNARYVSMRLFMQIACSANNIETMRYIHDTYDMQFTYEDVWTALSHCNTQAISLIAEAGNKIRQKSIIKLFIDYDGDRMQLIDKLKMLEHLLEHGMAFLGRRLVYLIVKHCFEYRYREEYEMKLFISILDRFGTDAMIHATFHRCLHNMMHRLATSFIVLSTRITYTNKHLHMVGSVPFWVLRYPEVEDMIWNKMQLAR